jgi:predicted metalloendopeptidase
MRTPLVVVCLVLGCASAPSQPQAPAAAAKEAAPAERGLDLSSIDRTVKPGDDFFRYANGGWIKSTEIPPDRSSWSNGGMLTEVTAKRVSDLIQQAAQGASSAEAKKIADTYASFMDEDAIEAKGLAPLRPKLDEIARISDKKQLARYLGTTLRADVDVLNATRLYTDNLFGLWVAQDLDEPSRYSPFLLQGGLGMPDRDYYLAESPKMAEVRSTYEAHVANMLKLAGVPDAQAASRRIVQLENRIAQAHWPVSQTQSAKAGNNHWKRSDFAAKAPGLDWEAFFSAAAPELARRQDFVVWQPSAITGISAAVASQPLQVWKEYLTFHAVLHDAAFLPRGIVQENFDFRGKTLTGALKLRDRWKRAVTVTDASLGEAVGKLYVERYFPASEKARVGEMVRNEIAAFRRRIDALEWMAPQTKEKAKAKLSVLEVGIGYPDRWRDYSGLEVVRGDALGNWDRAELFQYRDALSKLDKPVDRSEWVMNPHLVNAVNLPAMNALNFPAAILQPPYLDPQRPQVMDYASIGAIIGHEISHSFDNEGALFDADGRLRNWWTEQDYAHFRASSDQLVKQYDAYRPFPDIHVNGEQTLGENIADLAGLAAAYDAYRISLGGKEAPLWQGLTGDQQFFLSFAQTWRNKTREPALRQLVIADGHSPPEYRADTVRNFDTWYAAFQVKPGESLYLAPTDRIRIW